jgi:hypothetical protein
MSMQMHQQDHQALPSGALLPDDRRKLDEAYKETNLDLFVRPCNFHVFHLLVYAVYILMDPVINEIIKYMLTLFPVQHTNALDRAVVKNQLAETPSTGRSNRLGAV